MSSSSSRPRSLHEWLNAYKCEVCQFRADNYGDYARHVSRAHEMTMSEYGVRFGSSAMKWHSCAMCSVNLAHGATELADHFLKVHVLPLAEYFRELIPPLIDRNTGFNTCLRS